MPPKSVDEITREEFRAYQKVQSWGCYNMVMDANHAMAAAGLDKETYWAIIRNYNELYNRYK